MIRKFLVAVVAALFAMPAAAQSISPDAFSDTIGVGEMTMETFTVTVSDDGPATDLVDIFFLADNTGSMGGVINTIQSQATDLLNDIEAEGLNAAFGVGRYFGDPVEFGTNPDAYDLAYDLLTPISTDNSAVTAGIGAWTASGGGDGPEAGLFALHQAATEGGATDGVGPSDTGGATGEVTGWRDGATKVIVWFGDVNNHSETVDVAEAISALTGEDVIVVAISTNDPGLNAGFAGEGPNQATQIAEATGGLDLLSSTTGIVEAIKDAIGDVTSTIDLDLLASETFSGLGLDIQCASAGGCDDVGAGESRDFKVTFNGDAEGAYLFELCVVGLSDVCSDIEIVVGDGDAMPEVPVPAALPLLLTGLGGLSFAARRRKKD